MEPVKNKLQVWHFAQVPCKPFQVDVKDEFEAAKISRTLADQHLFLFDNKIIPDYANTIVVMMFDEAEKEWINYYNEVYEMEWDEFEKEFLQNIPQQLT